MLGFRKLFLFIYENVPYHGVIATACLQELPKQREPHCTCCHATSAGQLFPLPPVRQKKAKPTLNALLFQINALLFQSGAKQMVLVV